MWTEWERRQNAYGEGVSSQTDELGFGTLMFMSTDAADYHYTLDVTSVGVATLVLPFETTIPDGAKAYTLNYTSGTTAQATEVVTTLPANTPVLIVAEEGSYTFVASGIWQSSDDVTEGALTGVYSQTVVPEGSYILTNGDSGIGFRKVDGTTNKVDAYHAYLTAEDAGSRITIDFGGSATAIRQVESTTADAATYNLAGQRVLHPSKGIYIVNGRQVVVK